jgi:hypothetical protein
MSSQDSDSDVSTHCSEGEVSQYKSEYRVDDNEDGNVSDDEVSEDMENDYLTRIGTRCLKYIMISHTAVVIGLFLSLFWL